MKERRSNYPIFVLDRLIGRFLGDSELDEARVTMVRGRKEIQNDQSDCRRQRRLPSQVSKQ